MIREEFAVKRIEERKEADIPWFTQKASKVPRQGPYTIHIGHMHPFDYHRVPHLGLPLTWVLEAQAEK